MKFISFKNICLYVVFSIQIILAVSFVVKMCYWIDLYFEMIELHKSIYGKEPTWINTSYLQYAQRELFGVLSSLIGTVVTVLLFIKSNFSNSAKLSYEERKKYLQEKQSEKKQAKIEKLKNQIEEIEKD